VVWAEALMLRFHPAVSDYAADGDAAQFPIGRVHDAEFDHELGFRAGAAYLRPGSRVGLGVQVTWASPNVSASATAPAGGSLALTHNSPNGTDYTLGATATHEGEIDYLVVDAAVCGHRDLGCEGRATVWGGVRFAKIKQESTQNLSTGAGLLETVDSRADVTAFGLATGGELRWVFGGGWSVFGRAAGGILLSRIDASVNDFNQVTTFVAVGHSIERITPFVEMGVGVGWGCRRFLGSCIGLEVDLGWELTNWFNVLDPLTFVDDVKDSAFDQESDDLGIDAIRLRITVTF
jgi:hypothetical protein